MPSESAMFAKNSLFNTNLKTGTSITINGTTYSGDIVMGKNINITHDQVIIDGVVQSQSVVNDLSINISIEGNVESVSTVNGDVEVNGNVVNLYTTNGDVECGDVTGSLSTVNGDIIRA